MGKQWSVPTVKAMFVHLYGADAIWLARWTAASPGRIRGDADFPALDALRPAWDLLEGQQRAFVEGLTEGDLARVVEYRNAEGQRSRRRWDRCCTTWSTTPPTTGARPRP